MAISRRLSQAIDIIPSELQGTVDRKSSEEQRQVFLERIYADYAELQLQNDEVLERKWKIDADVFQSHNKEIHDILFGGSDGQERDMGDWDTWERVETMIKHCVYSRPSDFSQRRQHLNSYKDRIDMLNKAIVTQRQRLQGLNDTLNSQMEELSGLKNLLVLKEREISTLRNQNTNFFLQIRHAKREVSRIRGTKMMVEQDELMQDFQLLLEANKMLEKDNAAMRARLHVKYGTAELQAVQQMQELEMLREQQRFARPKHHHRHHQQRSVEGSAGSDILASGNTGIHFLELPNGGVLEGQASSLSSFSSSSSSSSRSSAEARSLSVDGRFMKADEGQPLEPGGGHSQQHPSRLPYRQPKVVAKKVLQPKGSVGSPSPLTMTSATDVMAQQEAEGMTNVAKTPSGIPQAPALCGGVESTEAPLLSDSSAVSPRFYSGAESESEEVEAESAEEARERRELRRARRRQRHKDASERAAQEANIKAYHGMMDALHSDQKRGNVLNANVPMSSVLMRIKKSNLALKRRMESEVENAMTHLDYDAAASAAGPAITFTVPTFAFESGPFTTFEGFRTKEQALEVLQPRMVEQAPSSLRQSIVSMPSLMSIGSTTAVLPSRRAAGGGRGSTGENAVGNRNAVSEKPIPPPPAVVQLMDVPKTVQRTSMPRVLSTSTSLNRADDVMHGQKQGGDSSVGDRSRFGSLQSTGDRFVSSGGFSTPQSGGRQSLEPRHFVPTERSWNALKHGILGIAQLSRAECLKREALHVLQLRQKLSYQQRQIDNMLLSGHKLGDINLSETKIPKFLSTGFGSPSGNLDDEEDDESDEDQLHQQNGHHGSYVMEDTMGSDVKSGDGGFSVVLGNTSIAGEGGAVDVDGTSLFDSPLGFSFRASLTSMRRRSELSSSLQRQQSSPDDNSPSSQRRQHRRHREEKRKDGEGGSDEEQGNEKDEDGKSRQTKSKNVIEEPNKLATFHDRFYHGTEKKGGRTNRSVVIQEDGSDWERRHGHNVVYENTEKPGVNDVSRKKNDSQLLSDVLGSMSVVVQGHHINGEAKRDTHTAQESHANQSSISHSSVHHSRRGSRETADEKETRSRHRQLKIRRTLERSPLGGSLATAFKEMKETISALRKRQQDMGNEIQEFIKLLQNIFGALDHIVEQRLERRLEAILASDGAGSPMVANMSRDFIDRATEARVQDLLHREHGIHLGSEESEEDGHGGRRLQKHKRPKDMSDEEWITERLRQAALEAAKCHVREEAGVEDVGAFVSPQTYHYFVGHRDGLSAEESKFGKGLRETQKENEKMQAQQQQQHGGKRGGTTQRRLGAGSETAKEMRNVADYAKLFHEMLHGGGAYPFPLELGTGGGLEGGADLNRTSDNLLAMMLAGGRCPAELRPGGVRGDPRHFPEEAGEGGVDRQRVMRGGLGGSEMEDSSEGGFDEEGRLKKPFHRVVRGHRIEGDWDPFMSLFPALFYDQSTSIGGDWYRVPLGANEPQVLPSSMLETQGGNGGGSDHSPLHHPKAPPGRTAAENLEIFRYLNSLQPRCNRATMHLHPTVHHYKFPNQTTEHPKRVQEAFSRSLNVLFGEDFNAFLRRYVLPIANTAKRVATANRRLDPSLVSAVRQLRREEEERRQHRVTLMFRRVATNIRSRLMLRRPVYHGGAFLGYMGMLYGRWRQRLAEQEEAAQREAESSATLDQLLDAFHLERHDGRSNETEHGGSQQTTLSPSNTLRSPHFPFATDRLQGHFQTEKSSYHFERARLPYDESAYPKKSGKHIPPLPPNTSEKNTTGERERRRPSQISSIPLDRLSSAVTPRAPVVPPQRPPPLPLAQTARRPPAMAPASHLLNDYHSESSANTNRSGRRYRRGEREGLAQNEDHPAAPPPLPPSPAS